MKGAGLDSRREWKMFLNLRPDKPIPELLHCVRIITGFNLISSPKNDPPIALTGANAFLLILVCQDFFLVFYY